MVVILMAIAALFAGAGNLRAQAPSKEYKLKAVFLFNFTQFIEWPAAAYTSPGAPFIIGIVGEDPFGNVIEDVVQNERVGSHPLIVQRYHDIKDMRTCHILFVNFKDPEKTRDAIAAAGRNTLTVGEADGFVKMGGMIRLATDNNRIKLMVYPDAAKAAELQISSKLLRVSEIYDPKLPPR